jgi:predicted nucleic acid-binding protein
LSLDHPVYDCTYLAVAQRTGHELVTADRRLPAVGGQVPNIRARLL